MNSLIAYINSHDGARVESVNGDRLTVSSLVRLQDGSLVREQKVIPATLKAARDYLGY